MVSTRHSMGAQEKLISLDSVDPRSTRSPSPRKRKMAFETPEQQFVDASATPFTQRRKREARDPADPSETESSDSGTEIAAVNPPSPEQTSSNPAQGNRDESKTTSPNHNEDSDEDDDDDEAPEVVSNITGAADAKARQVAQEDFVRKQQAEARDKRRARDEKLRLQREQHRQSLQSQLRRSVDVPEQTTDLDDHLSTSRHERPVLPRLLPEEILNAPQDLPTDAETSDLVPQVTTGGRHERFEVKKERTMTRKGDVTVQVLQRLRKDLAPKKVASVANLKKQWLTSRGQHAKDRRSIRKPLT